MNKLVEKNEKENEINKRFQLKTLWKTKHFIVKTLFYGSDNESHDP